MEGMYVDILCPRKTMWKGKKARNFVGGCIGADKKNGKGVVVGEKLVESVLEVKRVSDRLMAMKLEVTGSILNIVSAYAPQVNNGMEEKIDFWQDSNALIESVSEQGRMVLDADLNGYVEHRRSGNNGEVRCWNEK